MTEIFQRQAFFKRQAKRALYRNYFSVTVSTLIFSCVTLGVMAVFGAALYFLSSLVIPAEYDSLLLFFGFITLLILSPMIKGYVNLISQSVPEKRKFPPFEIFRGYENFRTVSSSQICVMSYFCAALILCAIIIFADNATKLITLAFSLDTVGVSLANILVPVILYGTMMLFSSAVLAGRFSYLYSSGFFSSIRMSRRCMIGHKGEFFLLNISFLPHFLLSAATFGLYFVFFALPYYVMTVSSFFSYVTYEYRARNITQI